MKTFLIAAAALLLAACSGSPEPQTPAANQAAPQASASTEYPQALQPLMKAQDKARNVENVLQKADDKRRKQLENMTGG